MFIFSSFYLIFNYTYFDSFYLIFNYTYFDSFYLIFNYNLFFEFIIFNQILNQFINNIFLIKFNL